MRDKILIIYFSEDRIRPLRMYYKDKEEEKHLIFINIKYVNIEYNPKEIIITYENQPLDVSDVKFVYISETIKNSLFISKIFETLGTTCYPSLDTLAITSNKTLQQLYFYKNNVPFVDSFFLSYDFKNYLNERGCSTFVEKPVSGGCGIGVKLQNTVNAEDRGYDFFKKIFYQREVICEYPKTDLRIITFNLNNNPEVICAETRSCVDVDKDFRTNLSLGNYGGVYTPTEEEAEIAKSAIKAIPGMAVAGVDVIKDVDGNYYVLEVNSYPGTQIVDITGIDFQRVFVDKLLALL